MFETAPAGWFAGQLASRRSRLRPGSVACRLHLGVLLTFSNKWIGVAIHGLVAAVWLVPDRRFARLVGWSLPGTWLPSTGSRKHRRGVWRFRSGRAGIAGRPHLSINTP